MRLYLIIFFILLSCPMGIAEGSIADYRFNHITKSDGLSHQHVTCFLQDDRGFIWIGTRNGLCLYDGYTIRNFYAKSGDTTSINHNFIRSLYQDSKKRIWIGTEKGICRYMPLIDAFKQYQYPLTSVSTISQNNNGELFATTSRLQQYNSITDKFERVIRIPDSVNVNSFAFDSANNLWAGTNYGLWIYNSEFSSISSFSGLSNSKPVTFDHIINNIYFDDHGNAWIGKNGEGVIRLNMQSGQYSVWNKDSGLKDGLIRSIMEDADGNVWIGTEKGAAIISTSDKIVSIQQDFSNSYGLNDNAIYSILRDRDNNMWIGTYFGGINIYEIQYRQFEHFTAGVTKKHIKGKAVRKIIEGNANNLWIATEDGGLNRLNRNTGEIEKISHPNISDNVHSLLLDTVTSELWIGMFRGGIVRYNTLNKSYKEYLADDASGLKSDYIFDLAKDKKGTVWAATTLGLHRFNKREERFERLEHLPLYNRFIYKLFVDSKDNLWVGTRAFGLIRIDNTSGNIKHWNSSEEGLPGLSDNFVTTIFEDKSNNIWVGTNNGGLNLFDADKEIVSPVQTPALANEKCIFGILEDDSARLWLSTNNGLVCYSPTYQSATKYLYGEDLPVEQFNYSSSLHAKNGLFYFGSVNGLLSFNPLSIRRIYSNPNIVFLNLYVGDSTVFPSHKNSPLKANIDATESITLTYKQSRLFSIEYAAVSPVHAENIEYLVKMDGIDNNWNRAQKQRRIVYSGIKHGEYVFRVKAVIPNQGSSIANERWLKIKVLPPYYLSKIAFLVYSLLLFALVYFSYRLINSRIRIKNLIRIEHLEKENIKAMNNLKIDFFTNVSHELKTPLTLILSPLQSILDDNELSVKMKQRLEPIFKNAHRMVKLIEELITFNKIESGQGDLQLQKGNPLVFIEELFYLFSEIAIKKQIDYQIHIENNDEEVWYSLSVVDKIISNLLSNALKYTPDGKSVRLSAAIIEKEDELFLNIEVADAGIGIAQNELDNIFTHFYQTARGKSFDKSGWGIGLALIHNLAKLHKGSITVQSKIDIGTTFNVLLNVTQNAFNEKQRSNLKANREFLDKFNYTKTEILSNTLIPENVLLKNEYESGGDYTLLVVDDNEELAQFLYEMFSPHYKVLVSLNGKEALKIARKYSPDLAISDIMMPEMDGIEFCFSLKNDLLTSHIPVILLTAKQGAQNTIEGYESGADLYVEKPFNVHTLELMVQNLLNTRNQNRKNMRENLELGNDIDIKNPRDEKLINDIKDFIHDNIDNEQLSVSDITSAMGISRTMLYMKMKNILDISISDYIRTIRLNKSKQIFLQGYNISETAFMVGFSDPNYFSKCFKKQFGISPSDFIAALKTKQKLS